mmetsp:Transcript_11891/g.25130  ORF Transcript_11891/g.25130 Transcript_11891/m.25130 type:complete len:80 (-) Transcript_11891:651-890(-)
MHSLYGTNKKQLVQERRNVVIPSSIDAPIVTSKPLPMLRLAPLIGPPTLPQLKRRVPSSSSKSHERHSRPSKINSLQLH